MSNPTYALGIYTRNVIGDMFTELGYRVGAEIGTHRGVFAREILRRWNGHLHCIDPWAVPIGYEIQSTMLEGSNGNREDDFIEANTILHSCISLCQDKQFTMHRSISQIAIEEFKDNSLDFIYIDGDHRPEKFLNDVTMWYTKIRKGGIICGHDWLMPGEKEHSWGKGIQRILYVFCCMKNIDTIYLIPEPNSLPWSFYFFKP